MIESKKYSCPECQSYGQIIVRGDELVCGNCEKVYTEEQAVDLTENGGDSSTDSSKYEDEKSKLTENKETVNLEPPKPDLFVVHGDENHSDEVYYYSELPNRSPIYDKEIEELDKERMFSAKTIREYCEEADNREELIRRIEKLCGIELKASVEKKSDEGIE